MRFSLLFFIVAATLAAQDQFASFGLKAGVPVSSASGLHENAGRWTAGVTAQFHIVWNLYFEADALIRKYTFSPPIAPQLDVTAWDFPFLLKYRFHAGSVRPFVDAGYSLSHESLDESTLAVHPSSTRLDTGPVAGLGVDFRYRRVTISPEIRCTWKYQSGVSGSNGTLVTALVGLTF